MPDLEDHPFSSRSVARESGAPDRGEAAWLKWAEQAENLLGHSLDGNNIDGEGCGYSLDEASSAFEKGMRPEAYVEKVMARERYAAPISAAADGPGLG